MDIHNNFLINIFVKIALIVILVNLFYSLAALVFIKNKKGQAKMSLKRKREILGSYFICLFSCILPYRIRELFILSLHFILHPMKSKILLISNAAIKMTTHVMLFSIYFLAMPVTKFLRKLAIGNEAFHIYSDKKLNTQRWF